MNGILVLSGSVADDRNGQIMIDGVNLNDIIGQYSSISRRSSGKLTVITLAEQIAVDLTDVCADGIIDIMGEPDVDIHYSVELDLQIYAEKNIWLCEKLVADPKMFLPLLDKGLEKAQKKLGRQSDLSEHLTLKQHAHIRLTRVPPMAEIIRTRIPLSVDTGKLISLKGTVIRTGLNKLVDYQRRYECPKCKMRFVVEYDREQYNEIPKPIRCEGYTENSEPCTSTKFKEIVAEQGEMPNLCKDYQEVRIQEQISKLAVGTIPRSIIVILEDDLVGQCKAGDDVTIIGTVIRRWKPLYVSARCDIEIAILANNIRIHNEQRSAIVATDEIKAEFSRHWQTFEKNPMEGRNTILKSVCPKVFGMFTVKLAVMLILIGGVAKYDPSGLKVRGDAHMLLVGDPGTGKSQFLRYAAKLSPRTILTTGIGSTNAGLTVTAVRDSGEWQLEAGALVLADRGLCCIDEFGSIREQDKTAIHEAMEQQTISVAKAGIVCKLNTRCAILAATNPKGKYDPNQNVSVNIALASPLLSRFDLILVLVDSQNAEWDDIVSSFILGTESNEHALRELSKDLWTIEKLQTYIQHVKASFTPKLSEDSMLVLKKYYQIQRAADIRNAARTTIRLLESLIRLAQAHARLMYQNTVTVRDTVVAVLLMEASMQSSALINITSTLHVPFPEDPDDDFEKSKVQVLTKLGLDDLITDDGDGDEMEVANDQLNSTPENFCSWEATQRGKASANEERQTDKEKQRAVESNPPVNNISSVTPPKSTEIPKNALADKRGTTSSRGSAKDLSGFAYRKDNGGSNNQTPAQRQLKHSRTSSVSQELVVFDDTEPNDSLNQDSVVENRDASFPLGSLGGVLGSGNNNAQVNVGERLGSNEFGNLGVSPIAAPQTTTTETTRPRKRFKI
ncbi:DNA helicase mcm9 [Nowakowskiella sp. JEL0407]|nr:DNA helicase mcm9 [Nowakowskiella sp. JEL0407]